MNIIKTTLIILCLLSSANTIIFSAGTPDFRIVNKYSGTPAKNIAGTMEILSFPEKSFRPTLAESGSNNELSNSMGITDKSSVFFTSKKVKRFPPMIVDIAENQEAEVALIILSLLSSGNTITVIDETSDFHIVNKPSEAPDEEITGISEILNFHKKSLRPTFSESGSYIGLSDSVGISDKSSPFFTNKKVKRSPPIIVDIAENQEANEYIKLPKPHKRVPHEYHKYTKPEMPLYSPCYEKKSYTLNEKIELPIKKFYKSDSILTLISKNGKLRNIKKINKINNKNAFIIDASSLVMDKANNTINTQKEMDGNDETCINPSSMKLGSVVFRSAT